MINNLSQLTSRKRLLVTLTTGALVGLLTSAPAMAAVSTTTETVIGHAPTLTGEGDVTIVDSNSNQVLDIGDVLTVNESTLTFADTDGDTPSANTYEWYAGANKAGTSGKTYTITNADLGKTITVKALAHTDPAVTDPAVATTAVPVKITRLDGSKANNIDVVKADDVTSVSISGMVAGKPMVGTELTASAVCAGGSPCTQSNLDYVWSVEGAPGVFTPIAGKSSMTYTPTKETQKKHIKVSVNTKGTSHSITRR